MNRSVYNLGQLRAALAAAETNWNAATWATAGMWKKTVHALRDRLALAERMEVIK